MAQHFLLMLFVVLLWEQTSHAQEQRKKLIIDNDAGGDDAMAIFIALLQEKYFNGPELVALTTVNGNTVESNVVINNEKILRVAKRQDVPIYRGQSRSLVYTPKASGYYGADGMGNNNESLEGLVEANSDMGAVEALLKYSKKYEGNLTVVTLGPLSNLAMAINLDPMFLDRLEQLYIAAGYVYGDKFPLPEFNALMDVEAYHVIANVSSVEKVTIMPFSQLKMSANISRDWRTDVLGAIDSDIIRAQNTYENVSLAYSNWWVGLDPAVVAVAINPKLVEEYKSYYTDISLCGEDRGINTFIAEANNTNVRTIVAVKKEDYMQFLLDTFNADAHKET